MNKRDQIQQEALEIARKHRRCSLGISMGVGKTLIGLKHINYLQEKNMGKLRVLVVAPKLSIFKSWEDDAEKFDIDITNIEFSTYLSLHKLNPNDYDLVVLDECHSLLQSSNQFLELYNGKILGLTGTPPRYHNSEKGQLVAKYCPIVYKYITDDAIDDNILNDYKIFVHRLPLDMMRNIKMTTKQGKVWMTSEVDSYAYWSTRVHEASTPKAKQIASVLRMKQMQEYKSKERYAKILLSLVGEKCILFANTQEQADRLCTHSYHSKNPDSQENLEAFSLGNINKLSCVLQLNEGVNIKGLKAGIIMHAYGNERKSSQRIGRLLRLNPDDTSTVHILCFADTIDEHWIKEALKDFDQSKITYTNEKLI
jgi:superfamily II DNA or RNA helicase